MINLAGVRRNQDDFAFTIFNRAQGSVTAQIGRNASLMRITYDSVSSNYTIEVFANTTQNLQSITIPAGGYYYTFASTVAFYLCDGNGVEVIGIADSNMSDQLPNTITLKDTNFNLVGLSF